MVALQAEVAAVERPGGAFAAVGKTAPLGEVRQLALPEPDIGERVDHPWRALVLHGYRQSEAAWRTGAVAAHAEQQAGRLVGAVPALERDQCLIVVQGERFVVGGIWLDKAVLVPYVVRRLQAHPRHQAGRLGVVQRRRHHRAGR